MTGKRHMTLLPSSCLITGVTGVTAAHCAAVPQDPSPGDSEWGALEKPGKVLEVALAQLGLPADWGWDIRVRIRGQPLRPPVCLLRGLSYL